MFIRWALILACAALLHTTRAAEEVLREKAPEWVQATETAEPEAARDTDGASRYRLVEMQHNTVTGERYERFVVELLNESAVESFSQLEFGYQPEYQTLILHDLTIRRDGAVQDRLRDAEIQTLRREKGMENLLYDGELSALIVLEDVRPGDVLSYSFTKRGVNPVFGGHSHHFTPIGFGVPIDLLIRRVIWDPARREMRWKIHAGKDDLLRRSKQGAYEELRWEQRNTPVTKPEPSTPEWVFGFTYLEYSDFPSWPAVRDWALPLYTKGEALPADAAEVCARVRGSGKGDEEQILETLRWVQRNIRYLGSFFGEHTHAPYSLAEVCRRRFGDCKDKGLLTVAMLRELGYDAAPALVNSSSTRAVWDFLPGPLAFDHLVVHLKFGGKDYLLDPTATYRRGGLEEMYVPDYGAMFIIRPETTDLSSVPMQGRNLGRTVLRETFTVDAGYQGADLTVETVATGVEADSLRSSFAESSREKMTEGYEKFYAQDFPGIESKAQLEVEDDEVANRVTVRESYRIAQFWKKSEEGKRFDASVPAGLLKSRLHFPEQIVRTQPLFHVYPERVHQVIDINMPTEWGVTESTVRIEKPAFNYRSVLTRKARGMTVDIHYESRAREVPVADYGEHRKAMAELNDDLAIQLWNTQPDGTSAPAEIAEQEVAEEDHSVLIALGLSAGGLALGIFLGLLVTVALWFWDPPARPALPGSPAGLGGWLIAPALRVAIMTFIPLREIVRIFSDLDTMGATLSTGISGGWWQLYYFVGAFLQGLSLLLAILQIILFFRRRTSLPWVFIGISLWHVVAIGLLVLMENFLKDLDPATGTAVRLKGFGTPVILSAYMLLSQRVRATFVRRRTRRPVPPPFPQRA